MVNRKLREPQVRRNGVRQAGCCIQMDRCENFFPLVHALKTWSRTKLRNKSF